MRDPHLYRLRKGTVRKKAARKGEGEMRKGPTKVFPGVSKSNEIRQRTTTTVPSDELTTGLSV
jgi:hypothetical protein